MPAEENKILIRRYFEAIDGACPTGNADVLDEFVASDFITHNPFPGMAPGIAGAKRLFKMFVAAAPGRHVIEDLIAEGDRVVGRITAYGTHEGELFGIERTGKPMLMTAITVWRIADGKIVEHWSEMDTVGLLHQLGATALPGPPKLI